MPSPRSNSQHRAASRERRQQRNDQLRGKTPAAPAGATVRPRPALEQRAAETIPAAALALPAFKRDPPTRPSVAPVEVGQRGRLGRLEPAVAAPFDGVEQIRKLTLAVEAQAQELAGLKMAAAQTNRLLQALAGGGSATISAAERPGPKPPTVADVEQLEAGAASLMRQLAEVTAERDAALGSLRKIEDGGGIAGVRVHLTEIAGDVRALRGQLDRLESSPAKKRPVRD
jgi:hypothetical protein